MSKKIYSCRGKKGFLSEKAFAKLEEKRKRGCKVVLPGRTKKR